MGTFKKKMARHDTASTSQPPSTGPAAPVIAAQAAQVPMALPRASPSNTLPMMARLAGTSRAAPTPCKARAAISASRPGRQAAGDGCGGEQRDADDEDLAPPEAVAQRAAHQHQRAQQEQIGIDDPLHLGQPGGRIAGQVALDGGQGDVDDGAVDKGHGRAQHRGGQRQLGMRRRAAAAGLGADDAFVTRGVRDCRAWGLLRSRVWR